MSAREIVADVCLWVGVALALIGCLGVLVFPGVYERLHFGSPLTLAAGFIAIAVVVQKSFSLVGDKTILIAVFLLTVAPVLTHVTARASRIAERGDWRLQEGEDIDVEEEQ